MEGYSGTPLAKKLGIKDGFIILLINTPSHYKSLFINFPINTKEVKRPRPETVDFIHVFCTNSNDFKKYLQKSKIALKKDGIIWVSWPKGTSKIETNINREDVRDYMLSQIGLVDIKVAAIDKDWSGLKFMYRKKDRH